MRILRIFKLVRHFAGLQSLFYTLQQAYQVCPASSFSLTCFLFALFYPGSDTRIGTSSEKKRYYVGIFPILGGGVWPIPTCLCLFYQVFFGMPKSSWGAKKHILLFWNFFVLGHLQKKTAFCRKNSHTGGGGGVFPRGNYSHIIPFFVSEDVPKLNQIRIHIIDEPVSPPFEPTLTYLTLSCLNYNNVWIRQIKKKITILFRKFSQMLGKFSNNLELLPNNYEILWRAPVCFQSQCGLFQNVLGFDENDDDGH